MITSAQSLIRKDAMTTETTIPGVMNPNEFHKRRAEGLYSDYAHQAAVEAEVIEAEHELQRRRDEFAAEVLSDPLLREGSDVAAVELLRVTTTAAVAQYLATVDQRNAAIHETRRKARELDLEGAADQVVHLARSTDPAAALRIDGRTVEANSAWQRTCERVLGESLKAVRQGRQGRPSVSGTEGPQ